MKGLMLSQREEARVQALNKVFEKQWSVKGAVRLLGISERHGWRRTAKRRWQPLPMGTGEVGLVIRFPKRLGREDARWLRGGTPGPTTAT